MDTLFFWIFFALFMVAAVVYSIRDPREKEKYIRNSLRLKGAGNIVISHIPLAGDRGNYVYNVEYEDARGTQHRTTCKVHALSGDVYWQDEV
jgi:hypothetical protein